MLKTEKRLIDFVFKRRKKLVPINSSLSSFKVQCPEIPHLTWLRAKNEQTIERRVDQLSRSPFILEAFIRIPHTSTPYVVVWICMGSLSGSAIRSWRGTINGRHIRQQRVSDTALTTSSGHAEPRVPKLGAMPPPPVGGYAESTLVNNMNPKLGDVQSGWGDNDGRAEVSNNYFEKYFSWNMATNSHKFVSLDEKCERVEIHKC